MAIVFGKLLIDPEQGAIHTHRDSYLLDTLTTVSVRRPFLPTGLSIGGGLASFCAAFGDLLYGGEIAVLGGVVLALVGAGFLLGRLSLISRDLRGSEFSSAIWGGYGSLQICRAQIVDAVVKSRRAS